MGPGALRLGRASPLPAPGCAATLAQLPACLEQGPGQDHQPTSTEVSERPCRREAGGTSPAQRESAIGGGELGPLSLLWRRWVSGARTGGRASRPKRPLSSVVAGASGADGGSSLPRVHPTKD